MRLSRPSRTLNFPTGSLPQIVRFLLAVQGINVVIMTSPSPQEWRTRERLGTYAHECRVRCIHASEHPGEVISKSKFRSRDVLPSVRLKKGSASSKCPELQPTKPSRTVQVEEQQIWRTTNKRRTLPEYPDAPWTNRSDNVKARYEIADEIWEPT